MSSLIYCIFLSKHMTFACNHYTLVTLILLNFQFIIFDFVVLSLSNVQMFFDIIGILLFAIVLTILIIRILKISVNSIDSYFSFIYNVYMSRDLALLVNNLISMESFWLEERHQLFKRIRCIVI